MHPKKFAIAATLCCLPIWLTGCETLTPKPPAELLEPCPVTMPPPGEVTFWDVYDLAVDRGADVDWCNATRIEPLRQWFNDLE